MGDFTKGKIYKIINFTDKQIYVGSTVYSLSERMMYHISKYKWWKSRRTKQYCSSFILFENHGFDNCKIVLLENYSCFSRKELCMREEFYRQKNINFCVNKIACYQTRIGARKKACEWKEKNKEKVKIYQKKYAIKKIYNIQQKKYDIQLKKFIKDYKKYVNLRETFESEILTFSEFYFKVNSINKNKKKKKEKEKIIKQSKKHKELLLNNQEKVSSREKNAERYICECGS